jgi:hypothetical protein
MWMSAFLLRGYGQVFMGIKRQLPWLLSIYLKLLDLFFGAI